MRYRGQHRDQGDEFMPDTATVEAVTSPTRKSDGDASIHSLLLSALRRNPRPDRARIAAYVRFAEEQARYPVYHSFLVAHRCWLAALDRALSAAARDHDLPFPSPADRPPELPPGLTTPLQSIGPILNRAQALGYLYVAEAFRLGGRVLCRELGKAAVGHDDDGPTSPAGQGDRPWRRLVDALEAARPEEHLAVLAAASALFAAWGRWIAPLRARLEAS
jgi:heme oxygenase